MFVRVLGSAAGGGFPQWNCNCPNCADVRAGKPGFRARTQSSIAVSADGERWVLCNASPDLRQQINQTPALGAQPAGGLRNSPIKAVIVTNADVDHIAGLINLREMEPLHLYGSQRVLDTLAANSIFNVLNAEVVTRTALELGGETELTPAAAAQGENSLGLVIEAFAVPGKVALFLEDTSRSDFGSEEGDTIGLKIAQPKSGAVMYYIPGCADVDAALAKRLRGADLVLFDGTLYSDDEMVTLGLSPKTGQRMGHISMSGPQGTIAAFAELDVKQKVFVHINNSNPVLNDNSAERKAVEEAGWSVAFDGMELKI